MTYDEMLSLITRSSRDDWTYIEEPKVVGGGNYGQAMYRHDLAVGLRWGRTHLEDFHASWVEAFSDATTSSEWVLLLYNGEPVDQVLRVVVDGGRVGLPAPRPGDESRPVERWKYELLRVVQEIAAPGYADEYAGYADSAGFTIID